MIINTSDTNTYFAVPVEFTVKSTVLVRNAESQEEAFKNVAELVDFITLPRVATQVGNCRILTDEKSIEDAQNELAHGLLLDCTDGLDSDLTIL